VQVDDKVWVAGAQSSHQLCCCAWLHEARHVLDAQRVHAVVNQLISQVHVVVKGVLQGQSSTNRQAQHYLSALMKQVMTDAAGTNQCKRA
jgi:hypothetical protein